MCAFKTWFKSVSYLVSTSPVVILLFLTSQISPFKVFLGILQKHYSNVLDKPMCTHDSYAFIYYHTSSTQSRKKHVYINCKQITERTRRLAALSHPRGPSPLTVFFSERSPLWGYPWSTMYQRYFSWCFCNDKCGDSEHKHPTGGSSHTSAQSVSSSLSYWSVANGSSGSLLTSSGHMC